MAVLQIIVSDDQANNADPANGVVQVKPDVLSLEAGAVVEDGVDVPCGETGPAAVGWRVSEQVAAIVGERGGRDCRAGH